MFVAGTVDKKMRLNRFYAAWLGPCHCFILAMIRLVRLSLCHNYLRLWDDGIAMRAQVCRANIFQRALSRSSLFYHASLGQSNGGLKPFCRRRGKLTATSNCSTDNCLWFGIGEMCHKRTKVPKFWELCQSNVFNKVLYHWKLPWEATLGYNMIHFTPIQPPGAGFYQLHGRWVPLESFCQVIVEAATHWMTRQVLMQHLSPSFRWNSSDK